MAQAQLTMRTATAGDVAAVLALVQAAYRSESRRGGGSAVADLMADERINAGRVLARVTRRGGAVLVAEDAGGDGHGGNGHGGGPGPAHGPRHALALARAHTAYLGLLTVDPARRATGVGRQLLAHAEAHARAAQDVGAADARRPYR